MKRIIVFGGSFDPVQLGHVQSVRVMSERFDKTVIVPCRISPFKTEADIAPPEDRIAMLRMSLAGLKNVEISRYETDSSGVSYTCRTLRHFKELWPDAEFSIAIGSDMLDRLNDWREADYLKRNARWFVTERQGFSLAALDERRAEGYDLEFSGITIRDYSSAKIKADLAFGVTADISEDVAAYIAEKGLYGKYPSMTARYSEFGMKQSRIDHTYRAVIAGIKLAKLHGEDTDKTITALILHDIGKYADEALLLEKGINVPDEISAMPQAVRHAPVGALIAEKCFGITDRLILDAIKYHTTGKPDMSLLGRIVYIADMTEAGRDFPGVETIRALACTDLDAAMAYALGRSLEYVNGCGGVVAPGTAEAYEYYSNKTKR